MTYRNFHNFITGNCNNHDTIKWDPTDRMRLEKTLRGLVMDSTKLYASPRGIYMISQLQKAYKELGMLEVFREKVSDNFTAICASHAVSTGDDFPLSVVMGIV